MACRKRQLLLVLYRFFCLICGLLVLSSISSPFKILHWTPVRAINCSLFFSLGRNIASYSMSFLLSTARESSLLISDFSVHSTSFPPEPLQTKTAECLELWNNFDLWLDELCFALYNRNGWLVIKKPNCDRMWSNQALACHWSLLRKWAFNRTDQCENSSKIMKKTELLTSHRFEFARNKS